MDVDLDDLDMPTFKGNFPRYKAELRTFLECFSCHGFLNGLLTPPADDAAPEEKSAFADKERVLWQALHRGLGARELAQTLEACGDAADALGIWKKFVQRKTHTTYGEHLARMEKFHNQPYERGTNVYSWIAEKIELSEMLSYGGLKISDTEIADVLLIGSRAAYPGLATGLVRFNSVGEPMPRPKLIDVMDALGQAWRMDQSEGKARRSPRHEGSEETSSRTPRTPSSHTARRHARDRRDERERRDQARVRLGLVPQQ